ncbi:MAG: NUDIX domain-containing protein [Bacteroidales bacterium]|nr:NUDIX domain-containing protein [Bacteroidales bacterium]
MYEVFINDKPVKFCSGIDQGDIHPDTLILQAISVKMMKENFSVFAKSAEYNSLIFYDSQNIKKRFGDFISLFWYLEAAGGVVRNESNSRLFIYRFGKWDLPKGKIEKSESTTDAALREVTEETGLLNPHILTELPPTYHIYEHKGKKILKRTYWYSMKYTGFDNLVPQTEEGITEARWFLPEDFNIIFKNTYASLFSLIEADLRFP